MRKISGFNQEHFDVLKELANIGSGSAITALSKMIGCDIEMEVPVANLVEFKDIANFVGGPESIIFGILVGLSGDINGMMMFIINDKSARVLINYLFNNNNNVNLNFTDIELSALEEVGNIVTSSYLGSLSTMINKKITPSVPSLSMDMANAILSVPAIAFSKIADKVLFIDSVFKIKDEENISGYFLLVPDMDSFEIIMSEFNLGNNNAR